MYKKLTALLLINTITIYNMELYKIPSSTSDSSPYEIIETDKEVAERITNKKIDIEEVLPYFANHPTLQNIEEWRETSITYSPDKTKIFVVKPVFYCGSAFVCPYFSDIIQNSKVYIVDTKTNTIDEDHDISNFISPYTCTATRTYTNNFVPDFNLECNIKGIAASSDGQWFALCPKYPCDQKNLRSVHLFNRFTKQQYSINIKKDYVDVPFGSSSMDFNKESTYLYLLMERCKQGIKAQ